MNIGDLVTRNSYNNDTVFEIIKIENNIYYLKGVYIRLYADSNFEDLKEYKDELKDEDEDEIYSRLKEKFNFERNEYFYLPGKILHIDGDTNYMSKCLKYYKKVGLHAKGISMDEEEMPKRVSSLIMDNKPNIVVITGHDALYKDMHYKNSDNFIEAIKEARKIEMSHEKLVIIAGACQSNYEELIKAGATFASSPKRVNIHALDPAIIASTIAYLDHNKEVDIKTLLETTTKGSAGIGGISTKGTMFVGYPR